MNNKAEHNKSLNVNLKALASALFLCAACAVTHIGCAHDEESGRCVDACDNILQCREDGYDDSDLQESPHFSSMNRCIEFCEDRVATYPEDATEQLSCVESSTSCDYLDHECDVF